MYMLHNDDPVTHGTATIATIDAMTIVLNQYIHDMSETDICAIIMMYCKSRAMRNHTLYVR